MIAQVESDEAAVTRATDESLAMADAIWGRMQLKERPRPPPPPSAPLPPANSRDAMKQEHITTTAYFTLPTAHYSLSILHSALHLTRARPTTLITLYTYFSLLTTNYLFLLTAAYTLQERAASRAAAVQNVLKTRAEADALMGELERMK